MAWLAVYTGKYSKTSLLNFSRVGVRKRMLTDFYWEQMLEEMLEELALSSPVSEYCTEYDANYVRDNFEPRNLEYTRDKTVIFWHYLLFLFHCRAVESGFYHMFDVSPCSTLVLHCTYSMVSLLDTDIPGEGVKFSQRRRPKGSDPSTCMFSYFNITVPK